MIRNRSHGNQGSTERHEVARHGARAWSTTKIKFDQARARHEHDYFRKRSTTRHEVVLRTPGGNSNLILSERKSNGKYLDVSRCILNCNYFRLVLKLSLTSITEYHNLCNRPPQHDLVPGRTLIHI